MPARPRTTVRPKIGNGPEGAAPHPRGAAPPAACRQAGSPPAGVSAAFLIGFLAQHGAAPGASPRCRATRGAAAAVQRRRREAGEAGPWAASLAGERHFVTGGPLAGRLEVHVAHAWDADFAELVGCLAAEAGGELDRSYGLDVFTADLLAPAEDPLADVQRSVAAAREVLLVLDAEARALGRLWVLFEALLALAAGKLRVRCSAPGGFGASREALRAWEGRIDAADWVLAQATRRADERRLRAFGERAWEAGGGGLERRLAQLKGFLRREVYGQLLLAAVEAGDLRTVEAALESGARPEQCDALGNTAEELAAFGGHAGIEELLFARRMRAVPHQRLSAFFRPADLLIAAEAAHPDVLAPFLTEAVDEEHDGGGRARVGDGGELPGAERSPEWSRYSLGEEGQFEHSRSIRALDAGAF